MLCWNCVAKPIDLNTIKSIFENIFFWLKGKQAKFRWLWGSLRRTPKEEEKTLGSSYLYICKWQPPKKRTKFAFYCFLTNPSVAHAQTLERGPSSVPSEILIFSSLIWLFFSHKCPSSTRTIRFLCRHGEQGTPLAWVELISLSTDNLYPINPSTTT